MYKILYFTSPSCNWCPYVEQILREIVDDCSHIELEIYDVTVDIDEAEQYNIVALPTIILPGNQRIVGGVDENFLMQQLQIFCRQKK